MSLKIMICCIAWSARIQQGAQSEKHHQPDQSLYQEEQESRQSKPPEPFDHPVVHFQLFHCVRFFAAVGSFTHPGTGSFTLPVVSADCPRKMRRFSLIANFYKS